MGCADCNTLAIHANENIVPAIVVGGFIAIYLFIRMINGYEQRKMSKKGIIIYWLAFFILYWIALQVSPVSWFDTGYYTLRM